MVQREIPQFDISKLDLKNLVPKLKLKSDKAQSKSAKSYMKKWKIFLKVIHKWQCFFYSIFPMVLTCAAPFKFKWAKRGLIKRLKRAWNDYAHYSPPGTPGALTSKSDITNQMSFQKMCFYQRLFTPLSITTFDKLMRGVPLQVGKIIGKVKWKGGKQGPNRPQPNAGKKALKELYKLQKKLILSKDFEILKWGAWRVQKDFIDYFEKSLLATLVFIRLLLANIAPAQITTYFKECTSDASLKAFKLREDPNLNLKFRLSLLGTFPHIDGIHQVCQKVGAIPLNDKKIEHQWIEVLKYSHKIISIFKSDEPCSPEPIPLLCYKYVAISTKKLLYNPVIIRHLNFKEFPPELQSQLLQIHNESSLLVEPEKPSRLKQLRLKFPEKRKISKKSLLTTAGERKSCPKCYAQLPQSLNSCPFCKESRTYFLITSSIIAIFCLVSFFLYGNLSDWMNESFFVLPLLLWTFVITMKYCNEYIPFSHPDTFHGSFRQFLARKFDENQADQKRSVFQRLYHNAFIQVPLILWSIISFIPIFLISWIFILIIFIFLPKIFWNYGTLEIRYDITKTYYDELKLLEKEKIIRGKSLWDKLRKFFIKNKSQFLKDLPHLRKELHSMQLQKFSKINELMIALEASKKQLNKRYIWNSLLFLNFYIGSLLVGMSIVNFLNIFFSTNSSPFFLTMVLIDWSDIVLIIIFIVAFILVYSKDPFIDELRGIKVLKIIENAFNRYMKEKDKLILTDKEAKIKKMIDKLLQEDMISEDNAKLLLKDESFGSFSNIGTIIIILTIVIGLILWLINVFQVLFLY